MSKALDEHREELLGLVGSGRLPLVDDEQDVLGQRSNVRRIARPSGCGLGLTDAIVATFSGSRGSSGAIEASRSSSCTASSATSPDARVVRYHPTGPVLPLRPLSRERRLAVAGGSRQDRDAGAAALLEQCNQPRALDDVVERGRDRRCDRLHHFPCRA